MLRSAACAFTVIALVCVSNLAGAKDDYSRKGCHLGFGVRTVVSPLGGDTDVSPGIHARGGCRGQWVGGEAHFEWLESFDAKTNGIGEVDGWALGLDGKLYPLAAVVTRFQP